METETLCSDEDAQDLLRESQISLLQLSTMEVAAQLSMRDFELFRNIESTEYVAPYTTFDKNTTGGVCIGVTALPHFFVFRLHYCSTDSYF